MISWNWFDVKFNIDNAIWLLYWDHHFDHWDYVGNTTILRLNFNSITLLRNRNEKTGLNESVMLWLSNPIIFFPWMHKQCLSHNISVGSQKRTRQLCSQAMPGIWIIGWLKACFVDFSITDIVLYRRIQAFIDIQFSIKWKNALHVVLFYIRTSGRIGKCFYQ